LALVLACSAISTVKPPKFIRTPYGLAWSECVHEVPSGSHIIEKSNQREKATIVLPDGTEQVLKGCKVPIKRNQRNLGEKKRQSAPDDGWQVWTAYNNVNNASFDSFLGYFNVPTAPQNFWGGILYFFTGLQNDNWIPGPQFPPSPPPGFDIIQPVLQYGGDSEDGGGNYWGLASWYVTLDSDVLYSTLNQLNDGDSIFGNMTRLQSDSTGLTWFIGGTADGQTTSITVTYPRLILQPWAYTTMELYSISDCSNLPPSGAQMTFSKLALYQGQNRVVPQWQVLENQNHCSVSISAKSPTTTVISF